MSTVTVSTDAELQAAINNASAGQTIIVRDGVYGAIDIDGGTVNAPGLTIRAENTHGATLQGTSQVTNFDGLTLEGLHFVPDEPTTTAHSGWATATGLMIANAANIDVVDNLFDGYTQTHAITHSGYDLPASTGMIGGQGLTIRGSDSVKVQNNEFTGLYHGVSFFADSGGRFDLSTNTLIEGNYFHAIRVDGVRGTDHDGTTIIDNFFGNFTPFLIDPLNPSQEPKDHSDFIQFWADQNSGASNPGVHNLTIEGNVLYSPYNTTAGIFGHMSNLTDAQRAGVSFDNFQIRDNVIVTAVVNGITLGSVDGTEVSGNVLLPNYLSYNGGSVPYILISSSERSTRNDSVSEIQYTENLAIYDNLVSDYQSTGIIIRSNLSHLGVDGDLHTIDPDAAFAVLNITDGTGSTGVNNVTFSTNASAADYIGNYYPGLADQDTAIADLLTGPNGTAGLPTVLLQNIDEINAEANAQASYLGYNVPGATVPTITVPDTTTPTPTTPVDTGTDTGTDTDVSSGSDTGTDTDTGTDFDAGSGTDTVVSADGTDSSTTDTATDTDTGTDTATDTDTGGTDTDGAAPDTADTDQTPFTPLILTNVVVGTDHVHDRQSEVLNGTNEGDLIQGFGGNDKIYGDSGDDYIIAGSGQDVFVRGGLGADVFEFGAGDELIKIADWESGIDKIYLRDGLTFDDLDVFTSNHDGHISTQLWLDENGDGIMDSRLVLAGVTLDMVSSDDFV